MSPEFMITTLVIVATPGTGVIYTISAGLSRGRRASLLAACGCTLGVLPHLLAALSGLAAILHASAVAFHTLKYLGVAYLAYLAWLTFRDTGTLDSADQTTSKSAWAVIRNAVLVNVLNPKLTVFFVAFLPQFVPADSPNGLWHMAQLSGVFMAVTLVVFVGYGMFASTFRTRVISKPAVVRWMRRSFASSYLVLAGRLAMTSTPQE